MKRALACFILAVLALSLVPGVAAAAEPVPGVSALVTTAGDGSNNAVLLVSFFVSADDPDQDAGSYTYNITVFNGVSWVSASEDVPLSDGVANDVIVFGGATFTATFNVTSDDGTGAVDSACTVTVDTSVENDYDVCGSMDPDNTYAQAFCLPTTGDVTGFNYVDRVTVESTNTLQWKSGIGAGLGRLARAGLNLGGDTGALRLDGQFSFASDGLLGEHHVFFSTVEQSASSVTHGDGDTTGSWANGLGFEFDESGLFDAINVRIWRAINGNHVNLYEASSWNIGQANVFTPVQITLNEFDQTVSLSLGADSVTVFANGAIPDLHTLWAAEGYGEPGADSGWLGSTDFCLSSTGGSNVIGGGGVGGVEDFSGEGGVGGPPMFPGVDTDAQAEAFGLEPTVFAWLLASILLAGLVFVGFSFAGIAGGGLGLILGVVLAVAFNLTAVWLVVVLFLIAVVIIVFGVRQ